MQGAPKVRLRLRRSLVKCDVKVRQTPHIYSDSSGIAFVKWVSREFASKKKLTICQTKIVLLSDIVLSVSFDVILKCALPFLHCLGHQTIRKQVTSLVVVNKGALRQQISQMD